MMASTSEPAPGEIWYARFSPVVGHGQGGESPCLGMADDRFNRSRAHFVLPIARTQRGLASHVKVDPPEGGLKAVSFVECEAMRSISEERLQSRWGKVFAETMNTVEDHLRILMNL